MERNSNSYECSLHGIRSIFTAACCHPLPQATGHEIASPKSCGTRATANNSWTCSQSACDSCEQNWTTTATKLWCSAYSAGNQKFQCVSLVTHTHDATVPANVTVTSVAVTYNHRDGICVPDSEGRHQLVFVVRFVSPETLRFAPWRSIIRM